MYVGMYVLLIVHMYVFRQGFTQTFVQGGLIKVFRVLGGWLMPQ